MVSKLQLQGACSSVYLLHVVCVDGVSVNLMCNTCCGKLVVRSLHQDVVHTE